MPFQKEAGISGHDARSRFCQSSILLQYVIRFNHILFPGLFNSFFMSTNKKSSTATWISWKFNKTIWQIGKRISHNSPVNYRWNVMTLANAVIALFGYHKEQQIEYNGSSGHSWDWMEERQFASIVCDN